MNKIIPYQTSSDNTYFNKATNGSNLASHLKRQVEAFNVSDLSAQLLNAQISNNIESYFRSLSDLEKELLKYLNYYYKKWGGNIQIPIKNIIENFASKGLACSARWIHNTMARLYDRGLVFTTGGGFGRKVTRRTFSDRGKMVITAITKGFSAIKQVVQKKCADYCADYSRGSTNNISSKENRSLEKDVIHKEEIPKEKKEALLKQLREAMK